MTSSTTRRRITATSPDHRVTPAELFFDLVFVYAITQVAALMADDLTASGVGAGVVVLGLLWWCWCSYAWLGNVVRADSGVVRLVLFAVMAPLLVIAITVPESFDDLPGGLHGPTVFVVCYLLVRLPHQALYWMSDPADRALHRAQLGAIASLLLSASVLFVGAAVGGSAQLPLWVLAFGIDFVGTYLTGAEGWRIPTPAHWAERHALIVIIALGESIVALGVGVADLPVSWPLIATVALGVLVAAAFWLLYFDGLEQRAEHRLTELDGPARTALARDGYTYGHLPLVAGVVVNAVGLKKVAEYVADTEHHDLTDSLSGLAAWSLPLGAALYVLGTVGFAARSTGELRRGRLAVGVGLLLAGAVVPYVPALVALLGLAVVLAALVAAESVGDRRTAAPAH